MDVQTEFDVVVLGTGAAGLTAAIVAHEGGASVGLFEKGGQVGGTSAWSGGMVWIPLNDHEFELGISDSRDEVLTYLMSLSHGLIDEKLAAAFVDTGPEMVRWLEANTPVMFLVVQGFPDYHPEHPGAKRGGGRSLECPLFAFDELGPWAEKVTVGPQMGRNITMSETSLGRGAPQGVPAEEMERRRMHDERGAGQGLVGRLLKGCLDRGIEPRGGGRPRSGDGFGPRRGGAVRIGGRAVRRGRAGRGDHGHRWLRVGPRARAGLRPRSDDPPGVGQDQHW